VGQDYGASASHLGDGNDGLHEHGGAVVAGQGDVPLFGFALLAPAAARRLRPTDALQAEGRVTQNVVVLAGDMVA